MASVEKHTFHWWIGFLFLNFGFLPCTAFAMTRFFHWEHNTSLYVTLLAAAVSMAWACIQLNRADLYTSTTTLGLFHYVAIVFILLVAPSICICWLLWVTQGTSAGVKGMLWVPLALTLSLLRSGEQESHAHLACKHLKPHHAESHDVFQWMCAAVLCCPTLAWITLGLYIQTNTLDAIVYGTLLGLFFTVSFVFYILFVTAERDLQETQHTTKLLETRYPNLAPFSKRLERGFVLCMLSTFKRLQSYNYDAGASAAAAARTEKQPTAELADKKPL